MLKSFNIIENKLMNMREENIINKINKIKYVFPFPFARDACLNILNSSKIILFEPKKFEMVMFKGDL